MITIELKTIFLLTSYLILSYVILIYYLILTSYTIQILAGFFNTPPWYNDGMHAFQSIQKHNQGCQFCSVSPGMAETFHTQKTEQNGIIFISF